MLEYQLEGNKDKSKILKEYKQGTSEDKEALFNRYAKVFRMEDKGTILEDYVRELNKKMVYMFIMRGYQQSMQRISLTK